MMASRMSKGNMAYTVKMTKRKKDTWGEGHWKLQAHAVPPGLGACLRPRNPHSPAPPASPGPRRSPRPQ